MTLKYYCAICQEVVDDFCGHEIGAKPDTLTESQDKQDEQVSTSDEEAQESPASYPESNA